MDMRHIFVTYKHMDHLMGIIWMVRMMKYEKVSLTEDSDKCLYSVTEK